MFRDKAFRERVHRMKVELIIRQGSSALVVGFFNVIIFAYAVRHTTGSQNLYLWVAAMVVIAVARLATFRVFQKTRAGTQFNAELWEDLVAAGAFLAAAGWGYASLGIVAPDSLIDEAFLGFVLAGTTAGAAVAYCTSMRTVLLYLLPATIPYAVRLLGEHEPMQNAMAFMLVMYTALLFMTVSRLKSRLIDALVVNFQKESLVDELKTTKDLFSQTAKMAELGKMAAAIAHEINNPLAILRGYNGSLQAKAEDGEVSVEDIKRITGKIDSTVVRMAKIVTGLKVFGRDSRSDAFAQVLVEKIVTDTLELCHARFKARAVELRVVPIAADAFLTCQEVQVSQVLLNLLNNALDAVAGEEGAWVQLELEISLSGHILTVTDSGKGIPEAIREKIMNPFFTTKGAGKGTGLGLSVAFDIMRIHGGTLTLDRNSNHTKFLMFFPRVAAEAAKLAA